MLVITLGVVLTMTVAHAPAADAHRHRALSAHLVGTPQIFCPDGPSGRFCSIEGRVRVVNHRAPGSGRILVCVGIDVIDGRGRSLSIEPPSTGGQAVAALGPLRYQVTAYRTTFRRPLQATRPVITHVHKHVVHGGQQC
jgi:hypothetical protein